jgi:hypothetical protein
MPCGDFFVLFLKAVIPRMNLQFGDKRAIQVFQDVSQVLTLWSPGFDVKNLNLDFQEIYFLLDCLPFRPICFVPTKFQ